MRRVLLCGVILLGLGIGGCGILGSAFGVKTDPTTGETTSDGTGGVVGSVAHAIGMPWAATGIAALAGLYAEYKRRGWKAAALSTFDAVEKWKGENPSVWTGLKDKLGAAHAEAHVTAIVEKALGNT